MTFSVPSRAACISRSDNPSIRYMRKTSAIRQPWQTVRREVENSLVAVRTSVGKSAELCVDDENAASQRHTVKAK